MRKNYLYLATFMLVMAFSIVDVSSQSISKSEKRKKVELKYPGIFNSRWMDKANVGTSKRENIRKPTMRVDGEKEFWGYLTFDITGEFTMGMGTFTASNASLFTTLWVSELNVSAGACANDVMYLQDYSLNHPLSLSSVDLITGKEEKITDYKTSDPIFRDMTYDYTTNTMYAVGGDAAGEAVALYSVDLQKGAITELFFLNNDLLTLAADNQGNIYGVASDGYLCQVFVDEEYVDVIDHTDEFPMYLQSMDFDRSDNTLYWAGFTEDGESFLATVDVKTGKATRIATPIGEYAEILALHVPGGTQSPNAPAPVESLQLEAGSNGSLEVKLSWINPSKTISGNELNDLTKIDIYRNDMLVHTLENPVVGSNEYWVDRLT